MSNLAPLSICLALLPCFTFSSVASSQSPVTWVKDINTNPLILPTPSNPNPARSDTGQNSQKWLRMGTHIYFQAKTGASGDELFKSDGKTATLVKDINPGFAGSSPSHFTLVGNKIYFRASTPASGTELWVTDGTASGTRLVKDINAGMGDSSPLGLASVGGKVVFSADDGTNGVEIWVSDGTAVGTKILKDISKGPSSSLPAHLKSNTTGSLVFFQAYESTSGIEIWATDGTASGTRIIKDIRAGVASSSPRYFLNLGASKVVFEANDGANGTEIWISDGSRSGTRMVKDVYAGSKSGVSTHVGTSLGKKVLFLGTDAANGSEPWITDGTTSGTMMLKNIRVGRSSSGMYFSDADGGKAYWGCRPNLGYQIWVTDGTPTGTKRISVPLISRLKPLSLTATGGKVFFGGYNVTSGTGYELCVTDGLTTKLVKDIRPGSSSSLLAKSTYIGVVGLGQVAFGADDGKNGLELWISKGTSATTTMIDINSGGGPKQTADDNVHDAEDLFGKVVFAATDGPDASNGQHSEELWIFDGVLGKAKLLRDIDARSSGGLAYGSFPRDLCRLGNYIYFAAQEGKYGAELWRTDGTTAGTKIFIDIAKGSSGSLANSSRPRGMTRIGNKIYFMAYTASTGDELWVTDGTVVGTRLIRDILLGRTSSWPRGFARLGRTNKVLFSAYSSLHGFELWITDGSAAGTKMVKDINGYIRGSSSPRFLTSYRGKVYFEANDGKSGYELWVSDGTASGTKIVKESLVGKGSGHAADLTVQNDRLFYMAYGVAVGWELHSSDGTAGNTGPFLDLVPGKASSFPTGIFAVGSRRIYFQGRNKTPSSGRELISVDVANKTIAAWSSASKWGDYPVGLVGSNGRAFGAARRTSFIEKGRLKGDNQLFYVSNGATAQPIGEARGGSRMEATDPRIGTSMTVKGTTTVANPFSVLCLGIEDAKPSGLGSFVPGAFAYFDLSKFFLIVAGQTGKTWASVLPVPNDVTLIGDRAVLQAFSLDVKAFPSKTEVTNGVHLTFGR